MDSVSFNTIEFTVLFSSSVRQIVLLYDNLFCFFLIFHNRNK